MKKIMLACFMLAAGLFLLGEQTADAVDEKSVIKAEVGRRIRKKHVIKKTWFLDYDRDGRNEAFLLTGKPLAPDWEDWMPDDTENDLWFAYVEGDGVKVEKIRRRVAGSAHLLKLKSATLMCAGNFCATSFPEDVYRVSGRSVKKIFHGDDLHGSEDGDDVVSVHSTYDMCKDVIDGLTMYIGHTWKPYYFYYKDGEICEYPGRKISAAAFGEYENGKAILKKYRKKRKVEVKKIIYRSNDLIHMNLVHKTKKYNKKNYSESYYYVTFRVNGSRLEKSDWGEGKYAVSMPYGGKIQS